jgi:hypothetical protein
LVGVKVAVGTKKTVELGVDESTFLIEEVCLGIDDLFVAFLDGVMEIVDFSEGGFVFVVACGLLLGVDPESGYAESGVCINVGVDISPG